MWALSPMLQKGELKACPIPDWTSVRTIYAVRHRNKLVTPALSLFWHMLVTGFSARNELL
ncbi:MULTISPECIES: LysR substrate-binding domain-containing protein [Paenibacillus]|uniref:LysR substrate-binding domain-containing protein n=1 Tax=Paenibacillus TaxID=44249 RepID=UPI003262FA48